MTLDRDGALLLPGYIPQDLVDALLAEASRIYAARDAMSEQEIEDAGLYDMHVRKRTIQLADLDVAGQRATDLLLPWFREYVDHEPEVSPQSFVRTIFPNPDDWHLPFHQDQTLLSRPLLNVWIALTACGVDAPGLECVRTESRELLPTFGPSDTPYVAESMQIEEVEVVRRYGEAALWHPIFEPGDVMVFRGTTVHRTYYREGMSRPRVSVEYRLV